MNKETIELFVSFSNLIATSILGLMAFNLTKKYSKKSQKLNEDLTFHQLFRDFNERYNNVNSTLNHLELNSYTLEELKRDEHLYNDVLDYLNLCAEEYFWHKKGRIIGIVWEAWEDGMNYWFNNLKVLRDAWDDEINKNGCKSYYIEDKYAFFKLI